VSTAEARPQLELDDLQGGILHPRPSPYVGTYFLVRIDDRHDGREALSRLSRSIASAANWSATSDSWLNVALTFQGLKALGVPQDSLDSFPDEFREGMAARSELLGDVGDSSPANWEKPLGTPDVHIALAAISRNEAQHSIVLDQAQASTAELPGVSVIWRQDCYALPTEREAFGFKDGISHPAIEGSGIHGSNPKEQPLKAGEFILGYPDETGFISSMPRPDALGRNGTYVLSRKLYQNVAAFRSYLRANAATHRHPQKSWLRSGLPTLKHVSKPLA
jgi:deferrochelatase/peroxidase EfeB